MTEKQIISLGFEKINVPISESGNKYDYYYYNLNLTDGFTLTADLDKKSNKWIVKNFDWPYIDNIDKNTIKKLTTVISNLKIHQHNYHDLF